ncbi:MAG: hypothetical protein IT377_18550 [Polyangiaceae bacterium]|nr:hypothetical protein [Polyangiaceae bacterium]
MKTAGCVAVLVMCWSSAALADGGPKITDSLWMPVGMNFGWAVNPSPVPNGFLVGPEVSLVYLDQSGPWVGVYTDALYDGGSDRARISAGGEVGYAIFGLDLGYVTTVKGEREHGFRARGMLSLAAVHLYGGAGRLSDTTYGELGVLLKVPIELWAEPPRRPWMDRPAPEPPQGPETPPGPEAPPGSAPPTGSEPLMPEQKPNPA